MEYPIRINKYLRDKGLASRRESDGLIKNGYVLVNGKRATLGMEIKKEDKVIIKEESKKKLIYLAYYKPRGIATQGLKDQPSVIMNWQSRGIFPVGRLDKESEGLLILTNDGRVTSKILSNKEKFEKEYIVEVKEKLRGNISGIFEKGMHTEIGDLLPAQAKILNNHRLSIILHEGKKHQIRVMLSELGYTITFLKRIRIGGIKLGNLGPDEIREFTKTEIDLLFSN
jgi:23S rRNA pseudouridine2604 synthase